MEGGFLLVQVLTALHPASFLEQLIVLESTSHCINSVTGTRVSALPCFCIMELCYLEENNSQSVVRLQPRSLSQWSMSSRTEAGLWAGQSNPWGKVSAASSAVPVCRALWMPLNCEKTHWWKPGSKVALPYRSCPLSGKACSLQTLVHHSYLNLHQQCI